MTKLWEEIKMQVGRQDAVGHAYHSQPHWSTSRRPTAWTHVSHERDNAPTPSAPYTSPSNAQNRAAPAHIHLTITTRLTSATTGQPVGKARGEKGGRGWMDGEKGARTYDPPVPILYSSYTTYPHTTGTAVRPPTKPTMSESRTRGTQDRLP
jgi:hypothetical protein